MRVRESPTALLSTMPVPIGVVVELSAPVMFWIVPPEQPLVFASVHVPPVPVTVKVPVVLLSTIPFEPPFVDTDVSEIVPPELDRLTAAALDVVTLTSPTVRLVALVAVNPAVLEPGWMFNPRTASLVAMTTLP